jgi:SAM-dependent methyltransferase
MNNEPPFGAYASFYDALYREKDYPGECDVLEKVFKRFAASPVRRVLDLGCGTGGHAVVLASRGYSVTGVDRSAPMLSVAQEKSHRLGLNITFQQGDIRSWSCDDTWDAVISMFAVLSYQVSHEDVTAAIATARRHLDPGGLFIFDVWFGPGVLTEPPGDRVKETQDGDHDIIRYASSTLDIIHQTVDVQYLVIHSDGDGKMRRVREMHRMRFFFPNELDLLLKSGGFRLLHLSPFGQIDQVIRQNTWNLTVIGEPV